MNIRIFAVALVLAVPFVMAQPNGVPPGPPPVEITGTVDTNVVNTPLDVKVVNVPEVVVANTPLDPVPTEEQRVPYQSASSFDHWFGEAFRNFTRDVPPDKILIAQTVSFSALVEIGQDVRAEVVLQGQLGSTRYYIPLTRQGTFNGLDLYVGTTSLTGFATGDGGVIGSVLRNTMSGDGGKVGFTISGYLVDIP